MRETALVTYRSVFVDNLRFFPGAVLAPLVLTLLITYGLVAGDLFPDPQLLAALGESPLRQAVIDLGWFLLGVLLLYIPHLILAVAWIRLTLLGPRRAAPPLLPRLGWAHCRAFGYLLLAALGGLGVLLAGSLLIFLLWVVLSLFDSIPPITVIGTLIGIVTMAFVVVLAIGTFLRLALALPVTLVAPQETLAEAWRLSSGQNLRLLIALLIVWVPVIAVGLTGFHLAGGSLDAPWAQGDAGVLFAPEEPGFLLHYLLATLLALLWTAVNASFIAFAFQTILRWYPPDPATAGPGSADAGVHAQPSRG
ncbi:MAG: hypothetical protein ACFCUQ_04645 [Kiloniellales bacterium]